MAKIAKYDIIVIGAGLGGLECAFMLAKHNKKVLVLEQDALLGGCLQTFTRKGQKYDTGFHYVGGLEENQMLGKLFNYFDLLQLPWVKMDNDFFDEVIIQGESYHFANGYDNFTETLAERFPKQRQNLKDYVALLKNVGDNITHSFDSRNADDIYQKSLFAKSAYQFLKETISDSRLIDVLSGTSLKMELNPDKLPLYVFAQINSTYIQSAYRLTGGGMQIAEHLRQSIEEMGGKVLRNSRVSAFEGEAGKATAVIVNNGQERYQADVFISDAHPAKTVDLLQSAGLVRKVYQKRIAAMENTYGMFTANIALKPGRVKYLNRNIYAYSQPDIWHLTHDPITNPQAFLISFQPPTDGSEFCSNIDILTPMLWQTVEQWNGTKIGNRGNDYDNLKEEMANRCIKEAGKYVEGLTQAVDNVFTSTPLTYSDYTSTPYGSAYGIRKDFNNVMYTILTPKTPVQNVFLTGQNLNLHGVLGTSMTAMFTCAEIIGMTAVVDDLKKITK